MNRVFSTSVLVLFAATVLVAQTVLPQPGQVYRFIHASREDRAGNVSWIEIWETQTAQGDLQWVMIDSTNTNEGFESKCYYAVGIGNGIPLYMVDGDIREVATLEQLRNELENRNLVINSELYAASQTCSAVDTVVINDQIAERCDFEDEDVSGLYLVKSRATAHGILWRDKDEKYPLQYIFEADGSEVDVRHEYYFIPKADIQVQPPDVSGMLCFDNTFPQPPDGEVISSSISFRALQSELTLQELQDFYDDELIGDWQSAGNHSEGGRIYRRSLDTETICTLELRFRENLSGRTSISASVYPEEITPESFAELPDLSSPVVVQNFASISYTQTGTIDEIVNRIISNQDETWSVRDNLTDIREGSAFVVLIAADGQQEMYITVDSLNGEEAAVRIETRAGTCGPTFLTRSR